MKKRFLILTIVLPVLFLAPFSKADPPRPMPQYGLLFCFGLGTFAQPGTASASLYSPTGLDVPG